MENSRGILIAHSFYSCIIIKNTKYRENQMKNRSFVFLILMGIFFYCDSYSWYSQLFPFNAGLYDEANVNFKGRNWHIFDYAYAGYKTGSTSLRSGVPCNITTIMGSGDITIELQQAIDNVGAAGGGIVRIPSGTYTITEHSLHGGVHPIGINYNNVSVEGAGSDRTIINIPPEHIYNNDSNAFEGVFTFEKNRWAWNKGWVDRGQILSGVYYVLVTGKNYDNAEIMGKPCYLVILR